MAAIRRDYYDPLWHIPHYYGDGVRRLFIGAAALMLFASPLYSDNMSLQLPFEILGALILVVLAAITSPRSTWVFIANSVAAAVGVTTFQMWTIRGFSVDQPIAFVFREAVAIVLLFALYFSVKTLRAMMLKQVGDDSGMETMTPQVGNEGEEYEPGDPFGVTGEYDMNSSDYDTSSY